MRTGACRYVQLAPRAEPEALADAGFRQVEVVLSTQYALETGGVGEGEGRRIQRHGYTALLGVDEGLTRSVTQGHTQLGSGDVVHQRVLFIPLSGYLSVVLPVLQLSCRLVVTVACHGLDGETGIGFQLVGQRGVAHVGHLVYRGPFPADKQVVFVRSEVLVHRRHHVVGVLEGDVVLRELPQYVFAFVEGVGHLPGVEPFLVFGSIGAVTAQAPVRVEVTGRHTAQTEARAVDVVAGYHRVDGAEVELAGMLLAARFHEVLNQGFRPEDDVLEAGNLFDAVHEYVHRALLLGEGHLAHFRPIFVALGKHVRLLDDVSFQAEEAGFYLRELIVAVLGGPLYFQALDTFHEV